MLSSSSLGQRETLNCKETVLFQAALQWAASECKRRQLDVSPQHCRLVLGDALYLIRLPTMALEDFANEAATSGVLTLQVTTPTRPRPQPHTRRTPRKLERVLFFIAKTSARLVCLFVCSFFRRRPTSFCTLRRATSRRCCTVAGRAPASSRKSATASSRRPIAAIRYAPAATPTWPRPLPDAEAADRRQVGRFQPTKVQHPLEIQGTHNGHSIRPSKSP